MYQTWNHIIDRLGAVLKQAPNVRASAFNEQFTVEEFYNVLFLLILSALFRQNYDPTVVLEIIQRTIY